MERVYDILESKGFISEDDFSKIEKLSEKDTVKIYEQIYTAVFDAQRERTLRLSSTRVELDPFTFLASALMLCDTCWCPNCRIPKLDFLGRFAALYANEVTVPLILERPGTVDSTQQAKALLSVAVTTLLRLRPLITGGIIKPAVMRSTHCVHVIEWVNDMMALVRDFAEDAAKQRQALFRAVYQVPEKAPTRRSTVYLEGPAEFLEHGSLVITFDEGVSWRAKTWRYDREGKTELRGAKKLRFVNVVFDQIAENTTFYLAYGRQHNARLLTDLPGDAFILNWLTKDEELMATTSAMEHLMHSVPILADLPIAGVLKIRRQERDSFEAYRKAITTITSDVLSRKTRLSKKEAQEILKAKIEPELSRLKMEMRSERRRQTNRIAGGLAALAAGIGIGAFGGLPIVVGGALAGAAAVAGGRLLAKAAEEACEHGVNLRQQNDFYFLLKLLKEEAPS